MQIALLPIPKTPFHATEIKLLQQMRRLTCLFYKNSWGFFVLTVTHSVSLSHKLI